MKINIDQGNKPLLLPVRVRLGNIKILHKDFYFNVTSTAYFRPPDYLFKYTYRIAFLIYYELHIVIGICVFYHFSFLLYQLYLVMSHDSTSRKALTCHKVVCLWEQQKLSLVLWLQTFITKIWLLTVLCKYISIYFFRRCLSAFPNWGKNIVPSFWVGTWP